MRILDLALKDLLQTARDKLSAVFLILMPVVFTIFFGLLFPSDSVEIDNRLQVALINHDTGGILASGLVGSLDSGAAVRLAESLPADREQILGSLVDGDYAGLLEIPVGFSEQLYSGIPVDVSLTADTNVPEGIAVRSALQSALSRVLGAGEAARLAAENAEQITAFETDAARRDFTLESYEVARQAWNNPSVDLASQSLQSEESAGFEAPTGYAQSSPGIMVQFAIFGLMIPGGILVAERTSRTFQRLMTTPLSRAGVLIGHGLGFFAVIFLQEFILIAVAQAFFKVNYLRQPLAVLLMMIAVAIMAACLGMLIAILAKKEEQVILYSLIAMFILAAMGGAWFPLEITGKAFSSIGHILPSAWAMDGFQNIIIRGLGIESVLLPALILLGYGLFFLAISVWRFSRE